MSLRKKQKKQTSKKWRRVEAKVEGGGRKDVLVEPRGGKVVGRGGVVEEGI